MTRTSSSDAEAEAIGTVAALMAAGARTAPKTRGVDTILTMVVHGRELEELAAAMEQVAATKPEFRRAPIGKDAATVRRSGCVVLVGVVGVPKKPDRPFDCGACGFQTCSELLSARLEEGGDFHGPVCVFAALELGVALGSAVKIAADMNIDNRMMYTIGLAAMRLRWLEADVIIGIPLSVAGKNIYFDRDTHRG